MFVFDRSDELSGFSDQINRLGVTRKLGLWVNVNKPRRPKADHPLIALRKQQAGCFVVDPVRLKMAVHSAPMNVTNQLAVIDPPRRSDRLLTSQSPFKAISQV